MVENNKSAPAVDEKVIEQARKIILGISPVSYLRLHDEELARPALPVGKVEDITPKDLSALVANEGDLEEDLQRLINSSELQSQLCEVSFNPREAELIVKAVGQVLDFINNVIIPLLEKRDEYAGVWYIAGDYASSFRSLTGCANLKLTRKRVLC